MDTKSWALFIFTYVAYVAVYFCRKPVSVVKSTLEAKEGIPLAVLGNIDSALLTAYAAGQFATGTVVGVVGPRFALTAAYAFCGVLCAAFSFATSTWQMGLAWAGCGLFASCVNPLLVLYVTDLVPAESRGSMVSLWATCQQVGGVVANLFASYLLSAQGWRPVFRISGIVVFSFAPLLALFVKPDGAKKGAKGGPKGGAKGGGAEQGTSVFSVPGALPLAAGYCLVKMARYCLMFWMPYFLDKRVGLGPTGAAQAATLFDVTGVLGSLATGVIVDKVYGGRMIAAVLPLTLLSALAFGGWAALLMVEPPDSPWYGGGAHLVAMALVGFAIAGPDGVLGGAASRNLCDYAGLSSSVAASVSGFVNGCGSLGAIVQGAAASQIVDLAGWVGLFGSLGAALVLTCLILLPAVGVERRALDGKGGAKKAN